MEPKGESKSTELESQLRGMILGNVKIANGQNHQDAQHTQRGRGRGRGGYGRGNHRGGMQQQSHNSTDQAPQASHPVQRGMPAVRHQGPRYPRQPTHHQAAAAGQHGPQGPRVLQRQAPVQGQANNSLPPHARQPVPYQPRPHLHQAPDAILQAEHLDKLATEEIPKVEMGLAEFEEKEAFRQRLEGLLRRIFHEVYPEKLAAISLVGFGSLASGFGMPGSDMDLAVEIDWKDPSEAEQSGAGREVPRLLERAVLDAKMGGRLLTRTRVPILKVCEAPTEALYNALVEERTKWDELPDDEQYPTDAPVEPTPVSKPLVDGIEQKSAGSPKVGDDFPELGSAPIKVKPPKPAPTAEKPQTDSPPIPIETAPNSESTVTNPPNKSQQTHPHPRNDKHWIREKLLGPLDFPKSGVGIQCDINFSNPLGIHNTHMLRCYSMTDTRVRPIVLFVKSWAKRRKINSSYSGTLSSYGWVLMVLHYLVNIASPPVCPNMQHAIPRPSDLRQLEQFFRDPVVSGYTVRFWRNEAEIIQAAQSGRLTRNTQSVGALLRGFFQYYASLSGYGHPGSRPPQFYWTNEVLSLRTLGGILSKQDKGWVSAKTTITAEKKVTNRYLFAIEDPFELEHNVARTVTHRGIVAIRDEFRRAWRILRDLGAGKGTEGGLFDEVVEVVPEQVMSEEVKKGGVKEGGDGVQQMTEGVGGL